MLRDNVDDYDGGDENIDDYDDNHLVNVLKDQVEDHLPVHSLTVADVKKPLKMIIIIFFYVMIIFIRCPWQMASIL